MPSSSVHPLSDVSDTHRFCEEQSVTEARQAPKGSGSVWRVL